MKLTDFIGTHYVTRYIVQGLSIVYFSIRSADYLDTFQLISAHYFTRYIVLVLNLLTHSIHSVVCFDS